MEDFYSGRAGGPAFLPQDPRRPTCGGGYLVGDFLFWRDTGLNNSDFKPVEFEGFRNQVGINNFVLTSKKGNLLLIINSTRVADIIKYWMRIKNTIELLGLWEKLNNPVFKLVECDQFKNEAGYNRVAGNFKIFSLPYLLEHYPGNIYIRHFCSHTKHMVGEVNIQRNKLFSLTLLPVNLMTR